MEQLNLEDIAINKHTQILMNMGCKIAVLTPDGRTLGNAEIKNLSVKTRKIRQYSWGEILNYAKPFFIDLAAGQSVMIPLDKYPMKSLSSTVTSYCTRNWGSETYMTRQHGNAFQVLRVA